jgi:hypothetical protein
MSETMLAALIGSGTTLLVGAVTLIVSAFSERLRRITEIQQNIIKSKRENLIDVYKKLISIVNLYPSASPNDILKFVDYPPNYSMERYDSLLISLGYQMDHYKEQLNIENIEYERKNDIETQILNREYAKKEILKNRDKYYIARDEYSSFCENTKVTFDIYAGQEVRNSLVEFEVLIHNVFISGRFAGDEGDPINNTIIVARRNLINSIRMDLGI